MKGVDKMATKTINAQDATMYYRDNEGELVKLGEVQNVSITVEDSKPKTIETLEDAARYAYGLSETRKDIAKIEEIAANEIARWQEKINEVEAWRDEVLKPLKDKESYLATMLTVFHVTEFNNAPNDKAKAKLKSIKLPYGVTLSSREQSTKIEVTDEAALLKYAKENKLVDVPEPKAKWSEIKKGLKITEDGRVFDSNGEEVTFVKAVPQERKFEVK